MKRSGIIGGVIAALIIVGVAAGFAIAWRPAIAAIDPPAPQSFDAGMIKRGRALAALGNCNDCHTVRDGKEFAGGLPVPELASDTKADQGYDRRLRSRRCGVNGERSDLECN